jgi:predicted Fe-Mo cluster-binding NifX family protein
MLTKIAISSQNKRTITGHAGKCHHFYIYTIDENGNFEKESLTLEKGNALHDSFHGDGNPKNPIFEMDIFLTESIGQGAIQKLTGYGVRTHIIKETDPDTAIKKLIEGTLQAYASTPHEHNHNHDHQHGEGGCKNCGGH